MSPTDRLPMNTTSEARPEHHTRREVLATLAAAGCACMSGAAALAGTAAAPEDRAPPAKPGKYDLGPIADFGEGVEDRFARDRQIFVIRKADTLFVTTSICTHKRCILKKPKESDLLKCPCHQSDFDLEGVPTGGPAKLPLARFAVLIVDGHLWIDTTQSFAEKDWGADGASVKIPS